MWGRHLKRRGRWWHYFRAVPERYRDVEARREICFSLRTQDFSEAKAKAAQISLDLDAEWQRSVELGASLISQSAVKRYATAVHAQVQRGFQPAPAKSFSNDELMERLRSLITDAGAAPEQKAVLGLIEKPDLTMMDAFERFWDHIEDEWSALSHDQRRVKRNGYLKALSNFREAVGDVCMYEVERHHAMAFRAWWLKRIKSKGLKPHTGNKDINALRRMISTNFDIDAVQKPNPLARVRLKDEAQVPRMPLTVEQIKAAIVPGALGKIAPEFVLLLRLLVNTGMRPVEAIGLELADILLDHEVPHVHVRKNAVRGLKTDHSERLLPLLGVSLDAAQELTAMGGWGKRLGKNMYATSIINRHLRDSGLVTDKRQSLYSLRHWFQDQLTKRDVVDRAQAQLMGHKFQRPKYGYGKDLTELRDIIAPFAIEAS
ncbi:DUF6538 domain-containing protein [Thalassococcus lentus]|uniref:Tyrosine-type recombinase/integrase n=1 Tax=Thalassococcus lentus TaxID=1210524 RepID=A0ABT4XXR1_9RHOB|nr:DUF6538 domain-containing protein [Thalassococcus lentus]MDA7426754.1 tyrosine-type recombinase/integrase [Thalassococcus lentus]